MTLIFRRANQQREKRAQRSRVNDSQRDSLDSGDLDEARETTGRFREEEYDRDDHYRDSRKGRRDYDPHMYPAYPMYPPVYPGQVYQLPPQVYATSYPPSVMQTPHFTVNEHTFAKTDHHQSPTSKIDEAVEKKLYFDVGTSPENPEVEVQTDPLYTEFHHDKEIQNSPMKKQATEYSQIFPSPSKFDPENKSMSMSMDPVTKGWVEALTHLNSNDYQSAYETVLSTGKPVA